MIVTDKKYYIDDMLLSKLDLMVKRMEGTDDNLLLIDGDEGQGKSECATGVCYYISYKTGRPYTVDNIFFDIDKAMEHAGKHAEQIIHLDEGALGLLTTQWWKKNQQKFIQFVMVARKKKHFIVICIPKFHRMAQYIIEERSIGLIHIYSRKNLQKGRFCYFTKSAKEKLYQDWSRKKIKNYKKHYVFHGSFVKSMDKVLGEDGVEAYEKKKDDAILNLTQESPEKQKESKFQKQRDILIKYVKETNQLSLRKMENFLESIGIELKKDQIANVISYNV